MRCARNASNSDVLALDVQNRDCPKRATQKRDGTVQRFLIQLVFIVYRRAERLMVRCPGEPVLSGAGRAPSPAGHIFMCYVGAGFKGWATAVCIVLLACLGCGQGATVHERVPEFSGATMGTVYKVKVVLPDPAGMDLPALQRHIEAALEDVNARMSTYRDDSELSRFNAHASTGPFPVSAATCEVFRLAQEISKQTGGVFDITVGPLVNAWGFGPEDVPENPLSDLEVDALLAHTGYGKIAVDTANLTVQKADPAMYCDLSAIAKGYAVDRVCAILEEAGFRDYMVEVGGEVRTGGVNGEGKPWRIGIVNPDPVQGDIELIVPLSGQSLATSGDYRNFYERNGVRYSHTIDPRTGHPITHNLASVSVIHKECAVADGYATALMVMGPEEALRWCEQHDVLAFLIIREAGGQFRDAATPAFERLMAESGASVRGASRALRERR